MDSLKLTRLLSYEFFLECSTLRSPHYINILNIDFIVSLGSWIEPYGMPHYALICSADMPTPANPPRRDVVTYWHVPSWGAIPYSAYYVMTFYFIYYHNSCYIKDCYFICLVHSLCHGLLRHVFSTFLCHGLLLHVFSILFVISWPSTSFITTLFVISWPSTLCV